VGFADRNGLLTLFAQKSPFGMSAAEIGWFLFVPWTVRAAVILGLLPCLLWAAKRHYASQGCNAELVSFKAHLLCIRCGAFAAAVFMSLFGTANNSTQLFALASCGALYGALRSLSAPPPRPLSNQPGLLRCFVPCSCQHSLIFRQNSCCSRHHAVGSHVCHWLAASTHAPPRACLSRAKLAGNHKLCHHTDDATHLHHGERERERERAAPLSYKLGLVWQTASLKGRLVGCSVPSDFY
jgi:hypothetical protein